MELMRQLEKMLSPLYRKLRMLATRGVVQLVDPSTLLQELQIAALGQEVLDNIEHWEPYGFTSNPHPGAEALLLSLGGDRDHTVAVNVADRRFRLTGLASGEVALATDEGDVMHFRRGNQILIDTMGTLVANAGTSATITTPLATIVASTKVVFDTPLTQCTGDFDAAGSVSDATGSMQGMRDIYNGHTAPGDSGGTTGTPNQTM